MLVMAVHFISTNGIAGAAPIPVGAWLGNGNANDSIGSNHGTFFGTGTTCAADYFGQAFSFDGGGDVRFTDDAYDILASGDITIVAWFNTNQGGDFTAATFEGAWILYFDAAGPGQPAPIWELSWPQRVPSGVDIRGDWHHVASVYEGGSGTASVFVDGVLKNSGVRNIVNGIPGVDPFQWNRLGSGYFGNYQGLLDEVAIYGQALAALEI